METWDAIRSRRNVRSYEDRPLDEGDLEMILEAGRRTPSSSNEQRWDFVVVRDPDRLERLSHIWQGARHIPASAATVALVGPDPDEPRIRQSIAYDMGQLTMSMMLAAADRGIGSGHASAHNVEVGREVLQLPEDKRVWWLIAFGYPSDRPLRPMTRPARRPLEDLVHHETW